MTNDIPIFLRSDFHPTLRGDLVSRRLGNERIIWSPLAPLPEYLDPVANVLAEIFTGDATTSELADEVSHEMGVSLGLADEQIRRVLASLLRAGALDLGEGGQEAPQLTRSLLPEPNW